MPKIIQFIHPGVEAKPKKNDSIIKWNDNYYHKRKFLMSPGMYVENGREVKADLTFWGEWEPQSNIEYLSKTKENYPTILNLPFIDPKVDNKLHNTDPYIFGDTFKYFICKQGRSPMLRNLDRMSLILFGSNIAGKFCLDTLFVVSDSNKQYQLRDITTLDRMDTQFYHAGLQPLISDNYCDKIKCKKNNKDYRYYEAVNFSEREVYNNVFSFVPSRKYTKLNYDKFVFKRPIVKIPEIVSDNLKQGFNASGGKNYSENQIKIIWNEIVEQITNQGLLLGTQFTDPPFKNE
jgi:hypothetical protein